MTYVLLIYSSRAPGEPAPVDEDRRALAAHRALQRDLGATLRAVVRLDELGTAHTVRATPAGHEISDGPYLETREWLVGFYLVDCVDEAAAFAHARRLADAQHAIEVRAVTWSR
jgi:hypothetical protein